MLAEIWKWVTMTKWGSRYKTQVG